MNDNIHLKKYLTKENIHSGAPHKVLDKSKNFDFFIVIPCYNEYDYLFKIAVLIIILYFLYQLLKK